MTFLAEKLPNTQSYTVCIHMVLANPIHMTLWAEKLPNTQSYTMYIHTVLANPIHMTFLAGKSPNTQSCTVYTYTVLANPKQAFTFTKQPHSIIAITSNDKALPPSIHKNSE
jgi:hypothetical protein